MRARLGLIYCLRAAAAASFSPSHSLTMSANETMQT